MPFNTNSPLSTALSTDLTQSSRLTYSAAIAPDLSDTVTPTATRSSVIALRPAIDNGVLAGRQVFSNTVGVTELWDIQQFQLTTTSDVTLNLSGLTADADLYLVRDLNNNGLWDLTTELIAYSENAGTRADAISVANAGPGTYYAFVSTYNGLATNYTFSMTADTAGSSLATARNLGILGDTSVTVNEFVGVSDPLDFYTFQTNGTTDFRLSMTGMTADADVFLIQDINLNGLLDDSDILMSSVAAGSTSESINYFGLAEGRYFVGVNQYRGDTNYALTMSATSTDIGNTYATAADIGMLSGQQTFRGSVGGTDLGDVYRFSVGTTSNLQLDLNGLSADADLFLTQDVNRNGVYDDADLMAFSTVIGIGSERINRTNLAAGDYFAWVIPHSGITNYTLTLTTDAAGNTLTDARDIGILNSARSYTDFVGNSDTRDIYRFQVANPTSVAVSLTGLRADADLSIIRDVNNNGVIDTSDILEFSANPGTAAERLTANLSTGTYFVQVNQYVSSTQPVTTPTDTNYVLRLDPIV